MLRISPEEVGGDARRYRIEGRLSGPYVAELGRVLEPSVAGARRVSLDLRGLTFLDAEGASLLRRLVARRVQVHGCSGFVAHLLGLP
jgi:hypothetical protein